MKQTEQLTNITAFLREELVNLPEGSQAYEAVLKEYVEHIRHKVSVLGSHLPPKVEIADPRSIPPTVVATVPESYITVSDVLEHCLGVKPPGTVTLKFNYYLTSHNHEVYLGDILKNRVKDRITGTYWYPADLVDLFKPIFKSWEMLPHTIALLWNHGLIPIAEKFSAANLVLWYVNRNSTESYLNSALARSFWTYLLTEDEKEIRTAEKLYIWRTVEKIHATSCEPEMSAVFSVKRGHLSALWVYINQWWDSIKNDRDAFKVTEKPKKYLESDSSEPARPTKELVTTLGEIDIRALRFVHGGKEVADKVIEEIAVSLCPEVEEIVGASIWRDKFALVSHCKDLYNLSNMDDPRKPS
jgi:hypothetical protein